jgi:hypothetical protein
MKTHERGTSEKVCTRCNVLKPLDDFYLRRRSPTSEYQYQTLCKCCIKERDNKKYSKDSTSKIESAKKYREANRDKTRQAAREYRERDPIANKARQEAFREKHRERLAKVSREWHKTADKDKIAKRMQDYRKANPEKFSMYRNNRNVINEKATPLWADFEAIRLVYIQARMMSEDEGIEYQVDHYYPLVHEFVCGLHVAANLQILTAAENKAKSNSFSDGDIVYSATRVRRNP